MMKTTTEKNGSIEFFRFFFITVIVLWHFHNIVPIFTCGDFAVDFFFILAGAMLYRSFVVHPEQDAVGYTFRRVKRIFPEWILTLVPIFLIKNRDHLFADGGINTGNVFEYLLKFLHEMVFLGQNGMYQGTSNYASWFICVLVVGGGILYAVLRYYNEKAVGLFFPVFALLALTFFYTLGDDELWVVKGCLDVQFLRGCAEIALGASLYYMAEKYQDDLKKSKVIVDVAGIISLVLLVVLLFQPRDYANYVPLFSSVVIIACLTDNSLFVFLLNGKIWFILGGISFEMLLIHGLVKPIVSYMNIGVLPPYVSVPLYLLLVILSAFALKWINGKIIRRVPAK